ncbi:MAG: ABC transporter ATP-binding protein [Gammaproteobacteria bacterium]|nr:ABC transporter ATP-binding protein [Gammaproteobacteria bacterium]
MTPVPLLAGRNLRKHYPMGAEPVQALRGVDIDVFPGDLLALRGPSGSGKTTLINLLGLLDRPDSGTLLLDGQDTQALSEDARADTRRDRFGFIFQTFNLIPVLTAAENVGYPMLLKPQPRHSWRAALSSIPSAKPQPPAHMQVRARELLAAVGLTGKEDTRPDLLSGGQRQRVAIARALANHPAVIFADEPTANLDSHTADAILDLLQRLNREQQVAIVVSTHDPRVVERCTRVLTLHDGAILRDAA